MIQTRWGYSSIDFEAVTPIYIREIILFYKLSFLWFHLIRITKSFPSKCNGSYFSFKWDAGDKEAGDYYDIGKWI